MSGQPSLSNADRIRDAERRLAEIEERLRVALSETSEEPPPVRVGEVLFNTSQGSAVARSRFLQMEHTGSFDPDDGGHQDGVVTTSERTENQSAAIAEIYNRRLPAGTKWPAVEMGTNDQWFFLPFAMCVVDFGTTGSIAPGDTGNVQVLDEMLQPTGVEIAARNGGPVPVNGRMYAHFDMFGTAWVSKCLQQVAGSDDNSNTGDPLP